MYNMKEQRETKDYKIIFRLSFTLVIYAFGNNTKIRLSLTLVYAIRNLKNHSGSSYVLSFNKSLTELLYFLSF